MDHSPCHDLASGGVGSPFLQLMSLGFVWVFLHCAPMCGPIVTGLNLNKDLHPFAAIGFYQLGRATIYGLVGAVAATFSLSVQFSQALGWVIVFVMGGLLCYQAFPQFFGNTDKIPTVLMKVSSWASQFVGWKRAFLFGLLFAFLPCMLTAWALTLAASTQSPMEGAALMLLLIVMTTIPLLSVSWGVSKIFRGKQKQISVGLLAISFVWTLLVTLAANEMISHFHLQFQVFGHDYKLMFW